MRSELQIAEGISLPIDAVTEKFAFLGRTGSGKTYAAMKLAEEMLGVGAQVVALDPVGVWWGLRLAADGKSPGIEIPVFGGLHGDIALEPTGGALVADIIVDRGISVVLDTSQFETDSQKTRFATDFADRLFFRKKASPSAIHVFLEECQEFIPQNTQRGEERMLHVWQRLIKLGRNFGIGASMITQRPQDVNKKPLNMTECVFAFQMTGPQERKAIELWIADKGLDLDIVGDLPKLAIGQAHIWSPQWLRISKTARISKKWTFNASSTPEVGKTAKARELAPIDLAQIQSDMAATIERAKADDPRELRKRITDLEAELKKAMSAPKPAPERIEVPVIDDRHVDRLQTLADEIENTTTRLVAEAKVLRIAVEHASRCAAEPQSQTPPAVFLNEAHTTHVPKKRGSASNTSTLAGGERKILTVLAHYPEGRTMRQVAVLTGYAIGGGGFRNYLGALRSRGLIEGGIEALRITEDGRDALGSIPPLPTGAALFDHWFAQVSKAEREILCVVRSAYPKALTPAAIAERTESKYSPDGGGFRNALGRLRTLELIEGRGEIRMSEELA